MSPDRRPPPGQGGAWRSVLPATAISTGTINLGWISPFTGTCPFEMKAVGKSLSQAAEVEAELEPANP